MRRVMVVNGPNLNLLGTREPEIYGSTTLSELDSLVREWGDELGIEVSTFQSNHEGAVIDALHGARTEVDGVVLNAGALTHYSYALTDAISAIGLPVVEVHISDVHARESWRHESVIAPVCDYSIAGRGIEGYRWALRHLAVGASSPAETIAYGDLPDQVADLRRPTGDGPAPAAVLVHGGFWRRPWTRDTTAGIAADLTGRGMLTWNVEYRRLGTGGDACSMVADVEASIRRLLDVDGVDPARIVVIGHSAGAQLAIAASSRMPDTLRPLLVVSLGGVVDLGRALEQSIGEGAVAGYLGDTPSEGLDPVTLLPLSSPVLVAHGAADARVPFSHARGFIDAARASGMPVAEVIADVGHFEWIDPTTEAWADVAERIEDAVA